jgi:hypothetical protein
MASLKYKPEKLKYLSNVNTLDEVHRKHALSFTSKKQTLAEKRMQVNKYLTELEMLEKKGKEHFSVVDIKQKSYLREQIAILEEEIFDVDNGISELEYYSQTNDILTEYYNIVDDREEVGDHVEQPVTGDGSGNDVIVSNKLVELNLISQKKRKVKKQTRKRIRKLEVKPTNDVLAFFGSGVTQSAGSGGGGGSEDSETETMTESSAMAVMSDPNPIERIVSNRASLFDEYLLRIDRNYASAKKKVRSIRMCGNCNVEKTLIQSDGMYVCQKCGEVENIIVESEIPNHKEGTTEKVKYPYKRLNHLVEFEDIWVKHDSIHIWVLFFC